MSVEAHDTAPPSRSYMLYRCEYRAFFYILTTIISRIQSNQAVKNKGEEKGKSEDSGLTEEAASIALTAAWNTFLGSLRLVVPLSTMLLS